MLNQGDTVGFYGCRPGSQRVEFMTGCVRYSFTVGGDKIPRVAIVNEHGCWSKSVADVTKTDAVSLLGELGRASDMDT